MMKTRKARAGRRSVLAALIVVGALSWLGSGPVDAGSGKEVICHATASDTNPWVRVEVSVNALPAHFGEVGSSHSHQHSLGRHDFIWTEDYDSECQPIPQPDPIVVECSSAGSAAPVVEAVDESGSIVTVDCPSVHSQVELPGGSTSIRCTRGSAFAPYRQSYWLTDGGYEYAVNCIVGDIVHLGIQGGALQVVCPAEGSLGLYQLDWLSIVVPASLPCTPGAITPGGGPLPGFSGAIDWNFSYPYLAAWMQCPVGGSLELYFLGEGAPTASTQDAIAFPCTAGDRVDVSRLVLTA